MKRPIDLTVFAAIFALVACGSSHDSAPPPSPDAGGDDTATPSPDGSPDDTSVTDGGATDTADCTSALALGDLGTVENGPISAAEPLRIHVEGTADIDGEEPVDRYTMTLEVSADLVPGIHPVQPSGAARVQLTSKYPSGFLDASAASGSVEILELGERLHARFTDLVLSGEGGSCVATITAVTIDDEIRADSEPPPTEP